MQWIDKVNGVDDVLAEDINAVAHGVQANETAIAGKQDTLIFDDAPTENSDHPVKSGGVYSSLDIKVDKVAGKGLSKNDFTDNLKNKLDGIEPGAEVNVQPDWNVTDTGDDAYIKHKPEIESTPTEDSTKLITSGGVYNGLSQKSDVIEHSEDADSIVVFNFSQHNNDRVHYTSSNFSVLEINIPSGEYSYDIDTGLSFDSPANLPTSVIYTASGELLNWIGTDCYNFEGNSVFRPQSGKHYDIEFYFNGEQFVGCVTGYTLATGQLTPVLSAYGVPSMTLYDCIDSGSLQSLEIEAGEDGGAVGDPGTLLDSNRSLGDRFTNNSQSAKRTFNTSKYYKGLSPTNAASADRYNDTTVTISGNSWTVKGRFTGAYNGYGAAIPIACEPSTKYSIKWGSTTGKAYMRWATYQSDGTFNEGGVVTTSGRFGVITTHSTAATLVLFLIPGADETGPTGDIEFHDIMVVEGEYTNATMPKFVPYGKYGIPFTIAGTDSTDNTVMITDFQIGWVGPGLDMLTINYDNRTAKVRRPSGPGYIYIDVTSQIDWSTVPYTLHGNTTITITSQILPYSMGCSYYSLGGN